MPSMNEIDADRVTFRGELFNILTQSGYECSAGYADTARGVADCIHIISKEQYGYRIDIHALAIETPPTTRRVDPGPCHGVDCDHVSHESAL